MNTILENKHKIILSVIYDVAFIGFIYLMPVLSHITRLPFYLFDPMRIIIISSLLFTTKFNTIVLALSLPLFAHTLSGHPILIKSVLISLELLINIFLFDILLKNKVKFIITFSYVLLSIILSKVFYYLLKYVFIKFDILQGDLISTPIIIQLIVSIIISLVFVVLAINKSKSKFTK